MDKTLDARLPRSGKQCPISIRNNVYFLYTEQSINHFGQKLTFFFKFNKFQPLKLFLKCRYVCQIRTEIQFHDTVDRKSLKFKVFSPDTEITEREQVIAMLDKPIMLNHGQVMLSKVPELHTIM